MSEEPQQLHKRLRWPDGVVLILGITSGIFTSIGYTIGAVGAWTAVAIWVGVCLVALLQNFIYAEMALMFPDRSGGIPVFAHEGWKRYSSLAGPAAANGYYMAWSFSLSIIALTAATLIKAQFFAASSWTIYDGSVHLGLEHVIAAAICLAVYAVNVAGLKPAMAMQYVLGIGLVFIVGVFIILPWFHGGYSASKLHWNVGGVGADWKTIVVFFYLAGWTAYGSEIAATFGPEFKDTKRDVPKAMIVGAVLVGLIYFLVPLGVTGTIGEKAIGDNPVAYSVDAFKVLIGPAAGLVTVLLAGVLIMSIISATADAGRVLYGMAEDDMTVTQLKPLNKRGVPTRQMTVDLLLNLVVLFFVGSPLAILFAANLGYFFCVVFALSSFLLLRKDRPDWPRPLRLGNTWKGIAAVLVVFNAFVLVIGATNPSLAGYGGTKEMIIAFCLFLVGPALFVFRRVVQDREPFRWRDVEAPAAPSAEAVELAGAVEVGS
jgi:amino acid transporter